MGGWVEPDAHLPAHLQPVNTGMHTDTDTYTHTRTRTHTDTHALANTHANYTRTQNREGTKLRTFSDDHVLFFNFSFQVLHNVLSPSRAIFYPFLALSVSHAPFSLLSFFLSLSLSLPLSLSLALLCFSLFTSRLTIFFLLNPSSPKSNLLRHCRYFVLVFLSVSVFVCFCVCLIFMSFFLTFSINSF